MSNLPHAFLSTMGWTPEWAAAFAETMDGDSIPARIVREHRGVYALRCEAGELSAAVSGRFRRQALSRRDFPAVGDWVVAGAADPSSRAVIHAVLPRRSEFVRRSAGTKSEEQVVAANVDTVFLVSGLDHDYNPRRIERYLTLAWESGADPVIVLNKADLHIDPAAAVAETASVARGVPVLLVSAATGRGLDAVRAALGPGRTGALLGSSGVGKSSLVNALLGEGALPTAPVRDDDSKGRHTTTHRELIPLPGGAMLIDTPGMRELRLTGNDASLERAFDDIAALARDCRFRDCSHTEEPGCAVLAALDDGSLVPERYESHLRQRREMERHRIERDARLRKEEKGRWKAIHRSMRHHHKRGKGGQV